tara:strand:+ start:1780 stop:2193 length:414 start_codon:yes stop_codon:yes gene_type:complete
MSQETSQIIKVEEDNVRDIIIECANRQSFLSYLNENTGVMIFKFGAKWCGPCKKIKTHVEDYFSVLPKNVICFDLDIDECSDVYAFLKSKRQVNGVPALLAYKMGNTSFAADFSYSGSNLEALKVFFERVILESSRI